MSKGGYALGSNPGVDDQLNFLDQHQCVLGNLPRDTKWNELTTLKNIRRKGASPRNLSWRELATSKVDEEYEDPVELGPCGCIDTLPDRAGKGKMMAEWLLHYETFKKFSDDPDNEEYGTTLSFRGITELHLKAWKGSAADIDAALEGTGINIDALASFDEMQIGQDGFDDVTPLHIALCAGNADSAKQLLARGANPRKWFSVAGHTIGLDRFGDYFYDCWQLAGPEGEVHELIRNFQKTDSTAPTKAEWDFRAAAAHAEEYELGTDDINESDFEWLAEEDKPVPIVSVDISVPGSTPLKFLGQVHHGSKVTAIAAGHVDNGTGVMISGHTDGKLLLWQVRPRCAKTSGLGKQDAELLGHAGAVTDVVLAGKEQYAVSAAIDKQLRLWNLKEVECMRVFNTELENVAMAIAFDGQVIISAGGSQVKVWNTQGVCKTTYTLDHDVAALKLASCSKDGARFGGLLALCAEGKRVGAHDLLAKTAEGQLRQGGDAGHLTTLAVSPGNPADFCFAGDARGFVHAWSTGFDGELSSEHQVSFHQNDGPIVALATSPSDTWIVSASSTYTMLWNVDKHVPVQKIDGSFTSLRFSSSGRLLYAGTETGNICVFTVASPNVPPMS